MCRESMSEWLDRMIDLGSWNAERRQTWDMPLLSYEGEQFIQFIRRYLPPATEETS